MNEVTVAKFVKGQWSRTKSQIDIFQTRPSDVASNLTNLAAMFIRILDSFDRKGLRDTPKDFLNFLSGVG